MVVIVCAHRYLQHSKSTANLSDLEDMIAGFVTSSYSHCELNFIMMVNKIAKFNTR